MAVEQVQEYRPASNTERVQRSQETPKSNEAQSKVKKSGQDEMEISDEGRKRAEAEQES